MSATFKPLRSTHGFQSPGFSVSPTGVVTIAGSVTLDDVISAQQIFIQGIPILETVDSTISLSTDIKNSSLSRLGKLEELEITGDFYLRNLTDDVNISVIGGVLTINSTTVGNLDNVIIGATTPVDAFFEDVTVGDVGNEKTLTVNGVLDVTTSGTIPTLNNTTLTSTTGNITTVNSTNGNITTIVSTDVEADDIVINNTPVDADHATRKDYVDSRITAFSIAFGA